MATYNSFPPHHSKPSQPISPDTALSHLQAYLKASETSPYLLPNARIESSGPAPKDSSTGLVVHNLRRVEAGLRGEWLAPSLELDGGISFGGAAGAGEDVEMHDGANGGVQEDWQDLGEYQREQSVEEGELGQRQTGIANAGEEKAREVIAREEAEEVKASGENMNAMDKAARAKAKKERDLQRKREKAKATAPMA